MFGNDKSKATRTTGTGVETLIGGRVRIRGDVEFSGGLYVEGEIHGSVVAADGDADATLTLAEKGTIHGEVRAPHVVVNGHLTGDIYAAINIQLGASARVQGNVYYKVVEMAAGAMITGRLIHGDAPKALPKPQAVAGQEATVAKQRREAAA